jgi:hypothetical protein
MKGNPSKPVVKPPEDKTTITTPTSGGENSPTQNPYKPIGAGGYQGFASPQAYHDFLQAAIDRERQGLTIIARLDPNGENGFIYAMNKAAIDVQQAMADYYLEAGYDGNPYNYTEQISNGLATDPDYVAAQAAYQQARNAAIEAMQTLNSPTISDTTDSDTTEPSFASAPSIDSAPPPAFKKTHKSKPPSGFQLG